MNRDDPCLIIGTRGSRLALMQTETVQALLSSKRPDIHTDTVIIKTTGEQRPSTSLTRISGTGIFTRELDTALLEGRIDVAVHSLKDLPTDLSEGIEVAAVPGREDAREAFVSNRYSGLDTLPEGATVGTGSPRRRAQILAARSDLDIVDLRGNVETRLKKLDEGRMDAVLLACAGLTRLGLQERITERLPVAGFVPPPGQGALAVTVRKGDEATSTIVAEIQDPGAAREVAAERAFLARLGGGCKTPIACHAGSTGDALEVIGFVATPDGATVIKERVTGPGDDAEHLGKRLAEMLLSKGAGDILEEFRDA